jgi:hypothetical protein|tara:strand:- start:262 stop:1521 length:1260 start_codon:yes stop_codon:yes gene_type:complete
MIKKGLLILLCLPIIGFGQSWIKTFGDTWSFDEGIAAQQTSDSGYILLSTVDDTLNNIDYSKLIKTNNLGDTMWTRKFFNIHGSFLQQTSDNGYIITGRDGWSISLIKTDSQGYLIWKKNYLGNVAENWTNFIEETSDGGFIMTGKSRDMGSGNDLFLFKTDSFGDSIWCYSYFPETEGMSLKQTNDNGFIVTGHNALDDWAFLLKTDSIGDTLWSQKYNNQIWWLGHSVQQTTDGGFIIVGANMTDTINMTFTLWLHKTDALGDSVWTKFIDGSIFSEMGTSVKQTNDGGYIITGGKGWSQSPPQSELWLLKTDSLGDTLWTKTYNNAFFGSTVNQTIDGGYIISGNRKLGNDFDACLIKTDGNGNLTSMFNISLPNTTKGRLLKVIDVLGRETKGKKNQPLFYIYDDGTVEKRIVIE